MSHPVSPPEAALPDTRNPAGEAPRGVEPGVKPAGSLPRLVFLWENFGPMHADRCDAVAAEVRGEAEVVGLELYGQSDTYDWVPETGEGFRKVTLHPASRPTGLALLRSLAAFRRREGRAIHKGGRGRQIGRTKGFEGRRNCPVDSFARERNTKLHAVTDAKGRPIRLFMSAGQVSDYTGAAALLDSLPQADWFLADRGYDADWLRKALQDRGIKACIPGRTSRKKTIKYDKRRYKRRNRIEIMFGRLKDWRRVATRYDRCPETYLSAIALAATVLFWL